MNTHPILYSDRVILGGSASCVAGFCVYAPVTTLEVHLPYVITTNIRDCLLEVISAWGSIVAHCFGILIYVE